METEKNIVVLMAEDNEHDIVAIKRAWKKNAISNPLYIVNDGEECLEFLYRRGRYSSSDTAPRPGLLLLDINMPKMDGLTVLKHIRADPQFRNMHIVILTTSKADNDLVQGYELGANAYIVKPVGFENFAAVVNRINLFWAIVETPPPTGDGTE